MPGSMRARLAWKREGIKVELLAARHEGERAHPVRAQPAYTRRRQRRHRLGVRMPEAVAHTARDGGKTGRDQLQKRGCRRGPAAVVPHLEHVSREGGSITLHELVLFVFLGIPRT